MIKQHQAECKIMIDAFEKKAKHSVEEVKKQAEIEMKNNPNVSVIQSYKLDIYEHKFWRYLYNLDKPKCLKYQNKIMEEEVGLMEEYDGTVINKLTEHIYEDDGTYIKTTEKIMTEQIYKEEYESFMNHSNQLKEFIDIVPNRLWRKK